MSAAHCTSSRREGLRGLLRGGGTVNVTLLGPQRTPDLDKVVRSLNLEGPIATITAGWGERESDDGHLNDLLEARDINLSLHRRWLDVQDADPDFAAADRRRRAVLDEVQEIYLLRLDHALRAVGALQRRSGNDQFRADAVTQAIDAVRELDARHLDLISDIHTEFYATWPPHERPVIAEHRAAVEAVLRDAAALVITGGHVGVLIDALHLFNISAGLRSPVIAWSAGAMALTDRTVLFHDRPPQGPGNPEVYGSGLSLVRNIVPLPHARARLLLDDSQRMAVFARRFAPARCVLFETGTRVDTDADGSCPPGTRVLGEDGHVVTVQAS
jgi:hypothetical protein